LREEGKTAKDVQSRFPRRSLKACRKALESLPTGVPDKFTEEERQELLRQRQNGLSLLDTWHRFLPRKNFYACRKELTRLRIRHPEDARQHQITYFTSQELEYIKTQNSEGATVHEISRALGRLSMSVYSKIISMNLDINREEQKTKGRPWSSVEDAVLLRIISKELRP